MLPCQARPGNAFFYWSKSIFKKNVFQDFLQIEFCPYVLVESEMFDYHSGHRTALTVVLHCRRYIPMQITEISSGNQWLFEQQLFLFFFYSAEQSRVSIPKLV